MTYFKELSLTFRRFPRVIKLFYVSDIAFGLAVAIFATLFNLHLLSLGYTAEHVGRLQSLASLVMAAVAIPVGLVGDRWGRRGLYIAGSLLFGIPFLVMPWLTEWPWVVAAYLVFTLGNVLLLVNESPLLAGEVGPEQRAAVYSFMFVNFFIWNTLGIKLAGWLTLWLPAGGLSAYGWPLVIAGVLGLGSGLFRAWLPFRREVVSRSGLRLRPTRTTLWLGASSLLVGAAMVLPFSFSNVILAERFGYGPDQISTVLTVAGLLGWVGSLFAPWTSRRFGDLAGYGWVVALQGALLIGMGLIGAPIGFLLLMWMRAGIGTTQGTLFLAFSMEATPAPQRATASSYVLVGRNLGSAMTAPIYGAAIAAGSFAMPFALAGGLAVAAAALTVLAFRSRASTAEELGRAE